ncbi:MAG: 3-isopropylmalate dehydratase small subunit [Deltaproteobacteria bacterium]|nr:3-isopropylmalate dehydratase small subunit [Deltaproteobacteria bacterium]MBW2016669.1 3-isopropylmalate dehydratase small subunit [Deltaproteobacteria bacterium]MBW2129156.1 3-isopropylmalate dehydratase small subunit [Deltaproteobacteria bacterium]MBW2304193.1 3-isopropylmalate dehydratase small subunit [Deltaproteobacteria bacterium]
MLIKGTVHKFGANIDTDAIIPAKYANISDPAELGKHCLENADAGFATRVTNGDILMATTNFGCGSSREIAAWSIKGTGISCVVAISFARIFFRNAINIGLPLLECPAAVEATASGDVLEIDLAKGSIRNLNRNLTFQAAAYPDFIMELISTGGLVPYVRSRLTTE